MMILMILIFLYPSKKQSKYWFNKQELQDLAIVLDLEKEHSPPSLIKPIRNKIRNYINE